MESTKIKKFYDDFSGKVLLRDFNTLNLRQQAIMQLCDRFISKGNRILEIGCGVGIIAKHLQKRASEVISVDISQANITVAKRYAASLKNRFISLDITEDVESQNLDKFDAVLLPDVIEHIPKEKYKRVFNNIEKLLSPGGLVLITCPSPEYQDYLKKNEPEALQVVDEIVTLSEILAATSLKLVYFSVKNIWLENTYFHVVLHRETAYRATVVKLNSFEAIMYKIKSFHWRLKNKIFLIKIKNDL